MARPDYINLAGASALVVDASTQGAEVTAQLLRGLGFARVDKAATCAGALRLAESAPIDFFVSDRDLADGEDGCAFVRNLRSSRAEPSCWAPVILTMGHVRRTDLISARDCGANFILTKPISSEVLLARILWTVREKRTFIDAPTYLGPDRRFKFEGPPAGTSGRRSTDRDDPIGDATEPNLSQSDIDGLVKAQRVTLEI